jgi:hypothetical protein
VASTSSKTLGARNAGGSCYSGTGSKEGGRNIVTDRLTCGKHRRSGDCLRRKSTKGRGRRDDFSLARAYQRDLPSIQIVSEESKKDGLGAVVPRWGIIVAAIAGLSALVGYLTAIKSGIEVLFPALGPFDASVTIEKAEAYNPELTEKVFSGTTAQPAVKIQVQYLESKKGRSSLKNCHTVLWTENDFVPDEPKAPQNIEEETSDFVREAFTLPKNQYAKEAGMRVECNPHGVMTFVTLKLPEVLGTTLGPNTTRLSQPVQVRVFVCEGEYRDACGSTPNWIPCGTDVKSWARATYPTECQSDIALIRLSSVAGNRCGYDTFQVTCKSG